MKLCGIEFGSVWGASGVQGFFGEGYWFHKVWERFGLDWKGMTFVAKTTTLLPRTGNMPLREDFTPRQLFPRCVVVRPFKGVTLNSVGLSGPGAEKLFDLGFWQERTEPFLISFMPIGSGRTERLVELGAFVDVLGIHLRKFQAPVGLQLNFSCPNVGLHTEELVEEIGTSLGMASGLDIPLVPKFNILLPVEAAREISEHPACDALCVSNTLPWGSLPECIDWKQLFGSETSPLAHLGGGGLSGKPLLWRVIDWLRLARSERGGIRKPINAGGGILSLRDAEEVLRAGADSIFLGSIALLRPWRVRGIIQHFNQATA